MTRKKAIGILTMLICQDTRVEADDYEQALKMAISALERWKDNVCTDCKYYDTEKCDTCELTGINHSALEQQPCEDAVSREAVLNTLDNMDKALDENRTVKEYKALLKECYKELPSVTQKLGKWIDSSNGWMCSACNKDNTYDTNFCPNCGADMRGASDESDN